MSIKCNCGSKFVSYESILDGSNERITPKIDIFQHLLNCSEHLLNCSTMKDHKSSHRERPHFSQAVMAVAKANLKKYEEEADEAFLLRADIDRKFDKY
ncbi:hypothetical protein UFOVP459_44 [uncultured Caudovirales phage]|uniref:Uncharacterized protein n=1 Tax=uncultured Caudovirales phage TaxID=2100421 RepID=A0A6J5SHA4_9CAUD|nr:hypothetical protein UFOVP459_44 [uncultured Caudovirales phage]CAB4183159.1 hypothetical protein UFOVP1089_41 [uncultured Caudovirales phage]CAB4213045.1 hypothetical protein UFOVP1443_60 [uncultured Caudovirales phage]